jgi:ATP-dependent RNA helicase DHX36
MIDVYNYAARFDLVPTSTWNGVSGGRRNQTSKKLYEFIIELPEQNIRAIGRAKDYRNAELLAAISFKKQAEDYHSKHGSETMIVKDATFLTATNAKKFIWDFYKIVEPGVRIELQMEDNNRKVTGGFKTNGFTGQLLENDVPLGEPVTMQSKKTVESMAYLTAAVALKKRQPPLWAKFLKNLEAGNGEILKPVSPVFMRLDEDCVITMIETLREAREAGLPDHLEEMAPDNNTGRSSVRSKNVLPAASRYEKSKDLQERQKAFDENPVHAELRRKKEELPMNQYRAQVIDVVENNTYSIIVGATGSGKTTQVPQILLEKAIAEQTGAACNIICTQPRRIAATSVAARVAAERGESLRQTVGHHVRFDAKTPEYNGSILYCTTGILLQQLQHNPDDTLEGITHLVVDEVHERDILIDFLMILLKKVVANRQRLGQTVPKVVLMSATMDTEMFAGYFSQKNANGDYIPCPSISVPGRTFPVKEYHLEDLFEEMEEAYPGKFSLRNLDDNSMKFLEGERRFESTTPVASQPASVKGDEDEEAAIDWKGKRVFSAGGIVTGDEADEALVPHGLIGTTIAHIARQSQEGAILAFLPGLEDIEKVERFLQSKPLGVDFYDTSKYQIFLLHSSNPNVQTEVFNPTPEGCRKIILSTNIAETSVTIPEVRYVVDTGKHKEKRYDQVTRITRLQTCWVSKSNSKQRAGRAGRVQNGHYYALFPKARHESMRVIGLPEMLRSDLQEVCLDIRAQGFKDSIADFLSEAIEPPSPYAIAASVSQLQGLEALTEDEQLTPLGRFLAAL